MSLSVVRVEVENIKAIEHRELNLKGRSITVLQGCNGSGKTSLLDAIASVFEGGSDPSLIRHGAKTGKVVIELSDGTMIKKAQSAKGAQLSVTTANGEAVKSPQAYVESLAASFAFDPLAFIRAPKKERAAYLMRAMPLRFTGAELHVLKMGRVDVAGPLRSMVGADAVLDLAGFDKLRLLVYEKRRAANVAVKELESTVANLRRSLPADAGNGAGDLAGSLEMARTDLAGIIRQADADIADVRKDAEQARQEARAELDRRLAEIKAEEDRAVEEIHAKGRKVVQPLQQRIGELEGELKRIGQIEALKTHLTEQQERLAARADESDALARALNAMDELKRSRTDSLPVPGLELKEDGEVYRDGIPFDQLNQARQYVTSFEIASLSMGELPLVISDQLEHLDETQRREFFEAIDSARWQCVMADVTEGPLRSDPPGALR
jgi:hypothetical protein